MKHICNVAKEGRCKVGVGKCNHYGQHFLLQLTGFSPAEFCTRERFCEAQNATVHCVESALFPNINNLITVSEDLAREFVDWTKSNYVLSDVTFVCDRLATRFEEQLK